MLQKQDVRTLLDREPFIPMKLVKKDGKSFPINFKHVLFPMKDGVIVFKGIESATSHYAKDGYEHVNYESIERLEPQAKRATKNSKGKDGRGRGHK